MTDDTADAIVEHATALSRLDPHLPAGVWRDGVSELVRTMRMLAAPFVTPAVDRAFYRALKAASLRCEGVFVHLPDGRAELLVETRRGQQRIALHAEETA